MKDYKTFTIDRKDQVATITFVPLPPGSNISWELGCLFNELREDNSIRVIVLTGSGGNFNIPHPKSYYDSPEKLSQHQDPARAWHTFTGIIRCHQGMAEIEKPIIAKVNGDAIGFGSSIVFACDFIIAQENAIIMDHHMGASFIGNYNGERKAGGHAYSNVPGDGGTALIPLFMTPCKAKEYLMLAQPYSALKLAEMGIINYAVPTAELDKKVDEIVERLLQCGAYALARTKRLVNRKLADHLNLVLDASVAYEMTTQLQPHDIKTLG